MSADPDDLARFLQAQDAGATYSRAVGELAVGRKVSHWMWFVFPQIAGLGHSAMAQRFALHSLAQAEAYAAHDVLGERLRECSAIVATHDDKAAEDILGYVDARKLHSSMTLFWRAAPQQATFLRVLDVFFSSQPDRATDNQLALLHRSP